MTTIRLNDDGTCTTLDEDGNVVRITTPADLDSPETIRMLDRMAAEILETVAQLPTR